MDDHISDEIPLEYLAAIGAITLNFAALETALDFTVAAIFSGIDRMGDKEIPVSLKKKLGFIRRALCHERLAPVWETGTAVLDEVHIVKEYRHDVIHGALVGSGMDVIRVRYTKEKHVTSVRAAPTTRQLEAFALRVRGLHERALGLAIDVCNIARPENPMKNPFRK